MSSFYQRGAEKRRCWQEMRIRDPEVGDLPPRPMSPKIQMEQEKRMRREIANSNERRRMQSINSGFQTLKDIIPHQGGEKLSKAAILQHASDYIYQLEQDKAEILAENDHLHQIVRELGRDPQEELRTRPSPPPKRKKRDTESSDEGIGLACVDTDEQVQPEEPKREASELTAGQDIDCQPRSAHEEKSVPLFTEKLEEEPVVEEKDLSGLLMTNWDQGSGAVEFMPHPSSTPSPPSKPVSAILPFLCEDISSSRSLSSRNLNTIVEAIRHLEGDRMLAEQVEERLVPSMCTESRIPNSEESGTESSYDDSRSDVSSGRDSPDTVYPMDCEVSSSFAPCTTVCVSPAPPSLSQQQFVLPRHALHPTHSTYLNRQLATSEQIQLPLQLLHASPLSATAKCGPELQLPQLLAQSSVIGKRS